MYSGGFQKKNWQGTVREGNVYLHDPIPDAHHAAVKDYEAEECIY